MQHNIHGVLLFCDRYRSYPGFVWQLRCFVGFVNESVPVGAGDPVRHAWVGMVAYVGNDFMVSEKKKKEMTVGNHFEIF